MATKKVAKKEITKTTRARVQVVKITPEQFLAAINRFGQVCEFVEHHMREQRQERGLEQTIKAVGEAVGRIPEPPNVLGVEQMAYKLLDSAMDLQKLSESVRHRLRMGSTNAIGISEPAATNQRASDGPIKDTLDSIGNLLASIRGDVNFFADYIGN